MVEKAAELARQGVEFALATVVWRQAPSSGHQGARAIITADGHLHGWIGGACAEPVVIREAQRVIEEREPRLILLGTPDQFGQLPDGMVFVQMACQSEGALELYIEPVLASPHLVVVGHSPMATTLVDLAGVLGWRADLLEAADFTAADVSPASIVVIATQGHGDEEAVEQAVAGRPAFVGLVASRKRGEAVLGYLADRGVSKELLDEVRRDRRCRPRRIGRAEGQRSTQSTDRGDDRVRDRGRDNARRIRHRPGVRDDSAGRQHQPPVRVRR
jgi:xanthine dehydrogenase accessory factor